MQCKKVTIVVTENGYEELFYELQKYSILLQVEDVEL